MNCARAMVLLCGERSPPRQPRMPGRGKAFTFNMLCPLISRGGGLCLKGRGQLGIGTLRNGCLV